MHSVPPSNESGWPPPLPPLACHSRLLLRQPTLTTASPHRSGPPTTCQGHLLSLPPRPFLRRRVSWSHHHSLPPAACAPPRHDFCSTSCHPLTTLIASTTRYTPRRPLSSSICATTHLLRRQPKENQHLPALYTQHTHLQHPWKNLRAPPSHLKYSSTRERTHSSLHSPRACCSPSKLAGRPRTSPLGHAQVVFFPSACPSSSPSS